MDVWEQPKRGEGGGCSQGGGGCWRGLLSIIRRVGQARTRGVEGGGCSGRINIDPPLSPNEVHWPSLLLFSEAIKLIGRQDVVGGQDCSSVSQISTLAQLLKLEHGAGRALST